MLANREALGSVLEPFWLTSPGASFRVTSEAPFDVAFNSACRASEGGEGGGGEGGGGEGGEGLCVVNAADGDGAEPSEASEVTLEMCADSHALEAQRRFLRRLARPPELSNGAGWGCSSQASAVKQCRLRPVGASGAKQCRLRAAGEMFF